MHYDACTNPIRYLSLMYIYIHCLLKCCFFIFIYSYFFSLLHIHFLNYAKYSLISNISMFSACLEMWSQIQCIFCNTIVEICFNPVSWINFDIDLEFELLICLAINFAKDSYLISCFSKQCEKIIMLYLHPLHSQ